MAVQSSFGARAHDLTCRLELVTNHCADFYCMSDSCQCRLTAAVLCFIKVVCVGGEMVEYQPCAAQLSGGWQADLSGTCLIMKNTVFEDGRGDSYRVRREIDYRWAIFELTGLLGRLEWSNLERVEFYVMKQIGRRSSGSP